MTIFTYPFTFKVSKFHHPIKSKFSSVLSILKTVFFFQLLMVAAKSEAQTLTIDNYSGINTNMTFNSTTRTWSPTSSTAAANLDASSLAASINEGSVTVSNNDGYISFAPAQFLYTGSTGKTLTLFSSSNIDVSTSSEPGTPLIYVVNATGNTSIGGSGLTTNGGSFSSTGLSFSQYSNTLSTGAGSVTLKHTNYITIGGAGILTAGGAVEIETTGDVSISSTGVRTGDTGIPGGSFSSKGVSFVATGGSVKTFGGTVTIDHTGTVTLNNMETGGGNLVSNGTTMTVSTTGLSTSGGDVTFNHSGEVKIYGIQTGSGDFTSTGTTMSVEDAGLATSGGAVAFNHSGAVDIKNVLTGGGNFTSTGTTMTVAAAGLATSGGAVTFNHSGAVNINKVTTANGNFTSSGTTMTVVGLGLATGTGTVTFNHSGEVNIDNVRTNNGNFTSTGTDMTLTAAGLGTNGGDVTFNHSGVVNIRNVTTGGGNFYSTGTAMYSTSGGLSTVKLGGITNGGSVTFKHSGEVVIADGGMSTGSGVFVSTGPGPLTILHSGLNIAEATSARIVHAGISISNAGLTGTNEAAEILLHGGCNPVSILTSPASGNLQVVGSTITIGSLVGTNKLNLSAIATSDIILSNFIQTKGGNVVMHALGKIDLETSPSFTKGILTEGGNIELKSKTTISAETSVQLTTATGSGGVLTQTPNPTGSIALVESPVLGAGNITLVTSPTLTIPFGSGATEICNGIDDNCDGTIDEGLNCSPLPVRLVLFSATKEEQLVALQWTTALESNSYRFDVERSSNGKNWSRLGSRDAANNSSQSTYYTYQDTKPLKGTNLYRLKMVDYDGTFSYSRLQEVHIGKDSGITVSTYPNPSADRVIVEMSDWNAVKTIQLLTINGQVVGNYNKNPDSKISIKNLTPGIYFLQVTLTDGSVLSHKVIRE